MKKFKNGEIVLIKETRVKASIVNSIKIDNEWHYYLKGWGKPVNENLLEKI